MLLLNRLPFNYLTFCGCISIHLMLLLNTKWNILVIYTDCNFNTSNVTIKLEIILKIISTLRNFNTSNVTIKHAQFEMTCIGEYHFNTSNVTIKRSQHHPSIF